MAIYSTLANKAVAFKEYFKSLSNLDLDNSEGESFNTYNAVYKPNSIQVCISGALVAYTKA